MASAHSQPLLESNLLPTPLAQFARWYEEARQVTRVPEAVALATVGSEGQPSLRMVLCKDWKDDGFVFHTNYASRKGRELDTHGRAALLFYWDQLGRQVRIEGIVSRLAPDESDSYFASRPFGAQVGAWASRQSETIASRDELDTAIAAVAARYSGQRIPRPPWWGGFLLQAEYFEFWQNRDDRLHDRLVYERYGERWRIVRLQP